MLTLAEARRTSIFWLLTLGGVCVGSLGTGLHDPLASHLALLYALARKELVPVAYAEAVNAEYLRHEFGDSHLLLPQGA